MRNTVSCSWFAIHAMFQGEKADRIANACSASGLNEAFRELGVQLEKCERALVHFLDIKKTRFPRFYFVSAASLLDILANGRDPPRVMPHLADCFDALANLTLEPGSLFKALLDDAASGGMEHSAGGEGVEEPEEGAMNPSTRNVVTALISRDGESVLVDPPHMLRGSVEVWLKGLEALMRKTVRQQLTLALDSAANWCTTLQRDSWLYSYPAQAVLIASKVRVGPIRPLPRSINVVVYGVWSFHA